MQWIKEVELVDSVDELRFSSSIRGFSMPNLNVHRERCGREQRQTHADMRLQICRKVCSHQPGIRMGPVPIGFSMCHTPALKTNHSSEQLFCGLDVGNSAVW